MLQHDVIVDEAHAIAWVRQAREKLQLVEFFSDFALEGFTLDGIAVASGEAFRHGSAADEAVVRDFVEV